MLVLFVMTLVAAAAGIVLLAEMYRRDAPLLGLGGLGVLLAASVLGVVYGTLDSV